MKRMLVGANYDSIVDQFYAQVLMKDIAAAELDCKFAQQAINDLLILERFQKVFGGVDSAFATKGFAEKAQRLTEIRANCKAPYRIVGGLVRVAF